MRILQVCTNFRPGGIQRHVLDLTADLRARGHRVTLAGDGGDWAAVADTGAGDFVPLALNAVAGLGGAAPRRVMALAACARALRRVIRERRIELIHAHETAPALTARLAALGLGVPVVMTFHGAAPSREQSVARIGRLCADLVISPSRTSLDALIARGLPAARARHVGLGIAPLPAVAAAEVAARRAALLGARSGPLIFSLSRLQEQKGIDVMVEVARRVVAEWPGAVFVVAGGGPLADSVGAWAEAAGVAGNMRFLGPVSTVPLHLRAADIFLLTSRWEALPISIVEAFRAGLPVVATDCGGVRELVDARVGAMLPVGDAGAIAAALLGLIRDPAARSAKGAAALDRSREARFDPATVHGAFEALYGAVIAGRARR